MFLITGGRGAVATALTGLLHGQGAQMRVGSGDPSALALPDGVAGVGLDLADPATFPAALAGVTSVFLYAKPEGADAFVAAAHEAGVEHIVLLSSASALVPDPHNDPIATMHLAVERALAAGPIPATVLRPGAFAGNAGSWAWPIKAGRPVDLVYPGAYTEPIHELDIAESALAALTDPDRRGGVFALSGPASVTFREQVADLGRVLGRQIPVREITGEEWLAQTAEHLPVAFAQVLLGLWRDADGRPGEPAPGVPVLTGHPARPFAEWAADHKADFEA